MPRPKPRIRLFLILAGLAAFALSPLHAQIPTVVLQDVPSDVLIGEVFHVKVLFKAATTTGYAPFVELAAQYQGADCTTSPGPCDGLEIVGAEALFANGTVPLNACSAVAGNGAPTLTCPASQCPGASTTPAPAGCYFGTPAFPAGHQKSVFLLPFGSFVPTQPDVVLDVAVKVHAFADAGQPLQILARGGFRYGNSPTGSVPATAGPIVSAAVTPHVLSLRKLYLGPENETATGPNFPRQYQVEVAIAQGQTLQNVEIEDCFPSNVTYLSLASATPTPIGPVTFSNHCATVPFGTVTGGTPVKAVFNVFVPELDLGGQPVLGSSCTATSLNQATASGDWMPTDPRDSFVTDSVTATHTLADKCLAIQKSVAVAVDTGAPGPTPGDTLQYTLDFQVSDYRTIRNLVVDDYLSDGQTLLTGPQGPTLAIRDRFGGPFSGSFVSGTTFTQAVVPSAPCQAAALTVKPLKLSFQVSSQLALLDPADPRHLLGILTGGLASLPTAAVPAAGRIVFRARIDDQYQRQPGTLEPFVDQNDPLLNCTSATAQVLANVNAPAVPGSVVNNAADSSATEVRIVIGRLDKTVYAINGSTTFPTPPKVRPGDLVTFRIQYPFPSTDVEALKIVDFSPKPVLPIPPGLAVPCSPASVIPAVNQAVSINPFCSFAPTPSVTLSGVANENSMTFDYSDFNDPGNALRALDLRYTLRVSPAPFVDGLQLTNEVQETDSNTFGETIGQAAIARVTLCEPKLRIRKGVVSTSKAGAVFQPSPAAPAGVTFGLPGTAGPAFTGTIRSSNVASALFSDVSGVDGCDLVRYAIVVENLGCSTKGAFDIRLRDLIPSCLTNVANLQVRRGNGSTVICNGGANCASKLAAFKGTAGITLDDPPGTGALAAYSPNAGTNIAVITFDARIGCQVAAVGCCSNQVKLLNYAGLEGDPNNHVNANFSTPFPGASSPFADEARVCVQPALAKSIVTTSEAHTGNAAGVEQLAIGEIVTYRMVVTVPEGLSPNMSVADTLPAGLKWLPGSCTLAKTPPIVTQSQSFTYNNAALTLNLGNVSNLANTPAAETITVVCKALVLNDLASNVRPAAKPNSFSVRIAPAGQPSVTFASNSVPAAIAEPAGELVKTNLGSPIAGATRYRLTFTNTGNATAFDLQLVDVLPASLTVSGPVQVSGGLTCTTALPAGQVAVTCGSLPAGATLAVEFLVTNVPACGAYTNAARIAYTSLPGLRGTGNATPGASGAADGERIYNASASVTTDPIPCRLVAVAAGGVHSLVLRANGTVAAWGNNGAGQLGNGATANSSVPVNVSGLTSVKSIAGGDAHSLALRQDGTVWAWGRGDLGQLGNGASLSSSVPLQVTALSNVTAIAGGGYHSLALTNETVRAWGYNGSGQLGNGSSVSSNLPVAVTGLSKIVAIAAGLDHSLAVRNDGTVWAWGRNTVGQLGIGSVTVSSNVPVQVKGPGGAGFLTNIVAVSAGFNHSLALRNDGTIWAWGSNSYGQLGIPGGGGSTSSSPVQVAGVTGALSLSAGGDHSMAVLPGGALRAWGRNSSGQLGIGTPAFSSDVPLAVPGLGAVQSVAGGSEHSVTLEDSGLAVHAWGFNSSGQLGDGTLIDRRSPVAVVVPCPHCAPPPANMTAWWTFDETSGTIAADRAGAAHNDAVHGEGPIPTPGKVAGALCFDGVNDRAQAPDEADLDVGTGDFTLDTWVRTTSGTGIISLVDKRELSPPRGYTLFLYNGLPAFQMAIGVGSSSCGSAPTSACTSFFSAGAPSLADNQWHHVAVTVDRDSPQGGIFYIDGQAIPGTFNPMLRPQSLDSGAALRIGLHADGGSGLKGCLDELEIFKRALTAAEIQAIYAAGSSGKCKC